MATTTNSTSPAKGLTAAQTAVFRDTGLLLSHGAALHHLRGETTIGREALAEIFSNLTGPEIPRPRQQTGCNYNCNQGRRCTCTGAPIPGYEPKPANYKPTALEQRASDFGALDLDDHEGYPNEADVSDALTPRTTRAARAWRLVWRAATIGVVVALGITVATALTGCGGGDDADRFEPALAMPQGVALVGDALPGLPTAGGQHVVVINRVGVPGTGSAAAIQSRADCEATKKGRQICVIVTTAADGEGAQIGKWLAAADLNAVFCDLTAPKADTAALLTRCAADAAAVVRTL